MLPSFQSLQNSSHVGSATVNIHSLLSVATEDNFACREGFYCCCLQRPETGPPGVITVEKQCGGCGSHVPAPTPRSRRSTPAVPGNSGVRTQNQESPSGLSGFPLLGGQLALLKPLALKPHPWYQAGSWIYAKLKLPADVSSTISQTAAWWLMNLDLFSSLQKRSHCAAEVRCVQMLEEALPVHLQTGISPG